MNEKVKRILDMVKCGVDNINDRIVQIESVVNRDIEVLKRITAKFDLHINVLETRNLERRVSKSLGLPVTYAYKVEFKEATAKFTGNHTLFYSVRDAITNYYAFLNVVDKKNSIKMKSFPSVGGHNQHIFKVIKEYKNGYAEYKKTPELLEIIDYVRDINDIFSSYFKEVLN